MGDVIDATVYSDTEVTREQAEAVLAAVTEQFRWAWQGFTSLDEDGEPGHTYPDLAKPQLVEHWESLYSTVRWAILWEEGPYEWAYQASMGGVDEEHAEMLHREFGASPAEAGRRATVEPIERDAAVLVEPINTWALGVYPA